MTKIRTVALAYALLIALDPRRRRRIKIGQALAEFDTFLGSVIREPSPGNCILPEEVIELMQRVESLLESHQDPQTVKLGDLAQRIVRDVRDLVMPVLAREATYDAGVMTCARIGLVAAAAFANHVSGMTEAHSLLCEVIYCLAVVQQRVDGDILPNEVIVLLRA